jgi:RNA polymerase sigma-70 factor (ECF subfamily)
MDAQAFIADLEQIKDKLYNYARRVLNVKADADDVLSEAVLAAWTQRDQFQPGTRFAAWMFRILINKVYTANRRRGLDKQYARSQPLSGVASSAESVSDIHELIACPASVLDGCDEDIRGAVARLNDSEREAFLLLSLGELTYAEIAQITGAPQTTVITRLSRARMKLRDALQHRAMNV